MKNSALKSQTTSNPMAEVAAISSVLSSNQLEIDDAIEFVVERACTLAYANGAAAAMQEGDEVVCRAATGQAPPVGSKLRVDSGISGECLRNGTTLVCENTETDTRVDREVCRALSIGATTVVPLRTGTSTVGVLQVFAKRPNTFHREHVLILETLAKIIADLVRGSGESSGRGGPAVEPALPEGSERRAVQTESVSPKPSSPEGPERRPVQSEGKDQPPRSKWPLRVESRSTMSGEDSARDLASVAVKPAVTGLITGKIVELPLDEPEAPTVKGSPGRVSRFWLDLGCALAIALMVFFIGAMIWRQTAEASHAQAKLQSNAPQKVSTATRAPATSAIKKKEEMQGVVRQPSLKAAQNAGPAEEVRSSVGRFSDQTHSVRMLPISHMKVTDPLSEYEIQSLSADNVSQLMTEAQSGDPAAELALGSAYELGRGVAQDCQQAAQWIMKSANQGNAAAEYNLGLRYAQGDGLVRDKAESQRWLTKAVNQGYLARRASYEATPTAN